MPFRVIKFCKHSRGALTSFSFSSLSPSAPLTTPSTSQLLCLPQCALYSEGPSDICIPSRFCVFFWGGLFFFLSVPLVLLSFLDFGCGGISLFSTCRMACAVSRWIDAGRQTFWGNLPQGHFIRHFATTMLLLMMYSAYLLSSHHISVGSHCCVTSNPWYHRDFLPHSRSLFLFGDHFRDGPRRSQEISSGHWNSPFLPMLTLTLTFSLSLSHCQVQLWLVILPSLTVKYLLRKHFPSTPLINILYLMSAAVDNQLSGQIHTLIKGKECCNVATVLNKVFFQI